MIPLNTSFNLDDIDIELLRLIQEDAEIPHLELAARVNLSPSPCSRRLRILKEAGVIDRTVSLVNRELLGFKVHVFVQVSMDRQDKANLDMFEQNVQCWPEVKSCYLMTGDYDYLLHLDLLDLDTFKVFLEEKLTEQPGISNIKSSFSLKNVVDRVGVDFDLVRAR